MLFRIVIILFFYYPVYTWSINQQIYHRKNLSREQWGLIQNCITNPGLTSYMKTRIHHILFSHYTTWAIHKAYVFKRFHKHKCRNIDITDLSLYGLIGLQNAIKKYNGKTAFPVYADIYISGELYKGLTELQPITNIPKQIRRSKTNTIKNTYNYAYKKLLDTQFLSYNEYWQIEKKQENNTKPQFEIYNDYDEMWRVIHTLPLFQKTVFQEKYNYEFDKIHSNKYISEKMDCSEEHIRKTIKKSIRTILQSSL